jgi:hypothetical protein
VLAPSRIGGCGNPSRLPTKWRAGTPLVAIIVAVVVTSTLEIVINCRTSVQPPA